MERYNKINPLYIILFLVVVMFLNTGILYSQQLLSGNEANVWTFGDRASLDFNTNPVPHQKFFDSDHYLFSSEEGCASFCDSHGQLLFYTNGINVYTATHEVMPNGSSIGGSTSSAQSSIIVPYPGQSGKYFIFTTIGMEEQGGEFRYSIVDMSLNSGKGDVMSSYKGYLIRSGIAEGLTAVLQSDKNSFWVVVHEKSSKKFLSYSVTTTGIANISSPVESIAGNYSVHNYGGYMKLSPDGKYIAIGNTETTIEVFNYNDATGSVSGPLELIKGSFYYGIEFSPNSSILYGSNPEGRKIDQYQIESTGLTLTHTINISGSNPYALQLGPDGKIYVSIENETHYIAAINNPDIVGSNCNFSQQAVSVSFPVTCRKGLPNFISSIFSGPPNSAFTFISSCISNTVSFEPVINDAVYGYSWTFGDGSTSTDISPLHTYNGPGSYQVSLTITYNGRSSTSSQTVIVGPPVVQFTVNDVCAGQAALFTNVTAGGSLYEWTFGDGATSIEQSPVHYYQAAGTYSVTLTVHNNDCQSTLTKPIIIGDGPTAVLEINNYTACLNTGLIFDATNSTDAITYNWDFGDGSTSTSAQASHSYSQAGSYLVSLSVQNSVCSDVSTHWVNILDVPITPQISYDKYICKGTGALLSAEILNVAQGQQYTYTWSFDGNTIGTTANWYATAAGTYTLVISGTCGQSQPINFNVEQKNSPEISVSITANTFGLNGISCQGRNDGSATVTIIPEQDATYTIAWSSGETAETAITLTQGNNYVTVSNNYGCSTELAINIPYSGPVVTTTSTDDDCSNIDTGTITANPSGGNTPYSYQWNHNGNILSQVESIAIELESGLYNLTVTDNTNCAITRNNIGVSQPVVSAELINTTSCGNDAVPVTAIPLFSGNVSTNPQSYTYEWGPSISETTNPVLLTSGQYTLTITDDTYGCSSVVGFTVTGGNALSIQIETSPLLCHGGNNAVATAYVSGGTGNYSYQWQNSLSEDISFTSLADTLEAGTYTLTVTDSRGCTATSQAEIAAVTELTAVWGSISGCNAEITATPSTGSYTYSWIMVKDESGTIIPSYTVAETSTNTITGLPAGYYIGKVATREGCTAITRLEAGTGNIDTLDLHIESSPDTFVVRFAWFNPGANDSIPADTSTKSIDEPVLTLMGDISGALSACLGKQEKEAKMKADEGCLKKEFFEDALAIEYNLPYHHYTLYYYDRAGNLTKTVPPEGVTLLGTEEIAAITNYRHSDGSTPDPAVPAHNLKTTYEYNSIKNLLSQTTPDGGTTHFIYDDISRLRFSQNQQQQEDEQYSYSKYDNLGRLLESGVNNITDFTTLDDNQYTATNTTDPAQSYPVTGNTYRTLTYYTDPAYGVLNNASPQQYLNNRVSYSISDKDGDLATVGDQSVNYYSYDPHGNVNWLASDIAGMPRSYLDYRYDLISGKVTQVAYNKNRPGQFYHRYSYDEDNRIVKAETSPNGVLWDEDARYSYYAHGPLRRMELGQYSIQGLDYSYTIQGWLKAINHPTLDKTDDPGNDDFTTNNTLADAFGMALGYYNNDFKRSYTDGTTINSSLNNVNSFNTRQLYNGNISSWSYRTQNGSSDNYMDKTVGKSYTYDRLNRIKESTFFINNSGWSPASDRQYSSTYNYDANGNIEKLGRHGSGTGNDIDSLVYTYPLYNGRKTSNRLTYVSDVSTSADNGKKGDIYGTHYYNYDNIGNLIGETYHELVSTDGINYSDYENTVSISWTPSGKVESVTRTRNSTPAETTQVNYDYDPMGNRIKKEVIRDIADPEKNNTTWYVRDAQGNIMSIYERIDSLVSGTTYKATLRQEEVPIYGSDRIAMYTPRQIISQVTYDFANGSSDVNFALAEQAGEAGYKNWLSPANKQETLEGSDKICNCRVKHASFNQGIFNSSADKAQFMGYSMNNVAVAEDSQHNLMFYTLTPGDYMGHKDLCIVYDKNGQLMKNSNKLKSTSGCKPMIMKKPGNNQCYYIFTTDEEGTAYYHEIDMAQQGYGTSMGKVVNKNTILDNSTGYKYGSHMALLEDYGNGRNILYTSRYSQPAQPGNAGTTELVSVEFVAGQAAPVIDVIASVASFDENGQGELQLSPDGKKLAFYNRKKYIAGFAHQQIDINLFTLGTDLKSVTSQATIAGTTAGSYGKSSVELSNNQNYLYYNQHGLYKQPGTNKSKNVWQQNNTLATSSLAGNTVYGEIRRSLDGKIYIAKQGSYNEFDYLANEDNLTVGTEALYGTANNYNLSGNLPGQPYRLLGSGELLFSRELGKKKYELKDHLGNVRETLGDERITTSDVNGNILTAQADVKSTVDYYDFGSEMSGRSLYSNSYIFGFGSQIKDDEWTGITGSHLNYTFREYDSRVVRFFAVDPIANDYPQLTPYQHSSLNPIMNVELEGLEGVPSEDKLGANGLPVGSTTAQSSTYIPKVDPSMQNVAPASTTSVAMPSPQTFIGPYNPNGLSEDYIRENTKRIESEIKLNENIKQLQALHPVSYGGPGFGLGLARDPFIQGAAAEMLTGGLILPILGKTGGAALWGVGKMLPNTRLGAAISSFEGIPSLNFTFGMNALKYTPGKFSAFNKGLSYTTDLSTGSSIEAYNLLGLGYQTGRRINTLSNSYNIYQTTLRGFYLSGKIATQPGSLGGATQFVGFKWFTGVRGVSIGKTTLGGF